LNVSSRRSWLPVHGKSLKIQPKELYHLSALCNNRRLKIRLDPAMHGLLKAKLAGEIHECHGWPRQGQPIDGLKLVRFYAESRLTEDLAKLFEYGNQWVNAQ
jgi:hypothetical protein